MRASYNWLKELSGVDVAVEEMAARLTHVGLEVEEIVPFGENLDDVVVAEVRSLREHPARERLRLVTVFDGDTEQEVVCGAPNVPAPGGRVLLARLGATLPGGFRIEERAIGGVVSRGMLCSEAELDLGAGGAGIFVFPSGEEIAPGTPLVNALPVRDFALEISLTPNRPDALGHVGLARELALLFGRPFVLPASPSVPIRAGARLHDCPVAIDLRSSVPPLRGAIHDEPWPGTIDVTIEDGERCPRYGAAVVTGVKVAASPFWLRRRLHVLGVRSINNVVDATNLILLEWGHPIHGFDLARLRGSRVIVRTARQGETLVTLDGEIRELESDDLLICDGEGAVALAGVMGGENSEIVAETSEVLIECAYFDPRSVRRTSKRLGLHTDASHRFERGVDPSAVPAVLAAATARLADIAGGTVVTPALDVVEKPIEPTAIRLRRSRVDQLLAHEVPAAELRRILNGLGCDIRPATLDARAEDTDALTVTAPLHRPDLQREVDLIEEVARIRGYEHIPTRVPRVRPSARGGDPFIAFVRRVRETAATAGLSEARSYAFVSELSLSASRAPGDPVRLLNPMSEERSVMRTSLLPGLIEAAGRSLRRQVERVALFEIGRTFHPVAGAELPDEETRLAILLAGARPGWIGSGEALDFFDGKGILASIVGRSTSLRIETRHVDPASVPYLHPRKASEVMVGDLALGHLGELHPEIARETDLPCSAVVAELRLRTLFEGVRGAGPSLYRPLPRFPAVMRDMAVVVADEHPATAVLDSLRESPEGLVESVELFDLYTGAPVPDGHRSLAFRVVYRDPGGTLTDDRVDRLHGALTERVRARFGAQIRGA